MAALNLHIGGEIPHPDWKILDIEPRPHVDYVGDAADLSQFADNSINKIYASHVLEHFHHGVNHELTHTLQEWHRVLKPGGELLLSVPDLRTLCWLYLHPNTAALDRHWMMTLIYGAQTNIYDVHKVGFDFDTLGLYLEKVGFQNYYQVSEFNLFDDSSSMRVLETLISLNVIAQKNQDGKLAASVESE